jgi:hypothetical protein
LLLDVLLKRCILPLVFFAEFFDAHHDGILENNCKTRSVPNGVTKSVLTLFAVEHMNAPDGAVVTSSDFHVTAGLTY